LKGCPLKCTWCCNPESQSFAPQLRYSSFKCNASYTCIEVCPFHAVHKTGEKVFFHFDTCLSCNLKPCIDSCNSGALMICGKSFTASEIVDIVKKDIDFYRNSGGGVTFTGGEPFSQPVFLKEILRQCKEANIHTAIETCGYASSKDVMDIIPFTDLFLFDLKIINKHRHEQITGKPNDIIFENLALIAASGKTTIVRIPLIPGITDTPENLEQIAEVVNKAGIREVNLEPYNPLGEEKYVMFGFPPRPVFGFFYPEVRIDEIVKFFNEKGIICQQA